MDTRQTSSTYDRDLDSHARAPREPVESFASSQRLIVNPLLAVAVCVAAMIFIRFSLQERALWLFLAALGSLGLTVFTVQFHCLDCGHTGWLLVTRKHACPQAMARWRGGHPARWRFPGPGAQLLLWLYLLASVTALIAILFALSR